MIQVKSIHTLIPHHAAWPAGAVPQEVELLQELETPPYTLTVNYWRWTAASHTPVGLAARAIVHVEFCSHSPPSYCTSGLTLRDNVWHLPCDVSPVVGTILCGMAIPR
ncbi:hypothetical protein INR49_028127, partial [Caranx melampygus]